MLRFQLCKEASGNVINAYNIGTITTIATEPLDTSRAGMQGLLFVIATGTVVTLKRQVSPNQVDWYNIYDSVGSDLSSLSTNITSSRYIILNNIGSSSVIAPWTRFTFAGTGSLTTITLYYAEEQD